MNCIFWCDFEPSPLYFFPRSDTYTISTHVLIGYRSPLPLLSTNTNVSDPPAPSTSVRFEGECGVPRGTSRRAWERLYAVHVDLLIGPTVVAPRPSSTPNRAPHPRPSVYLTCACCSRLRATRARGFASFFIAPHSRAHSHSHCRTAPTTIVMSLLGSLTFFPRQLPFPETHGHPLCGPPSPSSQRAAPLVNLNFTFNITLIRLPTAFSLFSVYVGGPARVVASPL